MNREKRIAQTGREKRTATRYPPGTQRLPQHPRTAGDAEAENRQANESRVQAWSELYAKAATEYPDHR